MDESKRPATVVIADDHPVYRDGLARAITRHPALSLVAQAGDGREAARLIEAVRPDVAVLDVHLPGIDGITLCAWAATRRLDSHTRVMLLSAYVDSVLVSRAVAVGAAGYLGKDALREEICEAILQVASGATAFSDDAGSGVLDALELLADTDAPPTGSEQQ
jgi:two-component system nitrate/nitrite response regulator NarL